MTRVTRAGMTLFFVVLATTLFPQKTYAANTSAKTVSAQLSTPSAETVKDNRALILKAFLSQYNSPLADSSEAFVKAADENGINWRLLVAISGVESTFGQEIPADSYNAWGWGIYGTNRIYFSSWSEAIETISKGIRERYINPLGTDDVYAIGSLYAESPTWAQRVEEFMNKIDKFVADNPSYTLSLSL